MNKSSRMLGKVKKKKDGRTHIFVFVLIILIGVAFLMQGRFNAMSAFQTTSNHWSGSIRLAGFTEDGDVYLSKESLPNTATLVSWGEDSIIADVDGPVRYYGYAGYFQQPINTELPQPDTVPNLDGYPTAKPKLKWTIMSNIKHVDVDGNYMATVEPSVTTQENGYLVEVYYYTFSIKLELFGSKCAEHDFYKFLVDGFKYGTRYMYDLAPFHGLYAIPEIALTPLNDSIIDMGSDLATYGSTQWKFYKVNQPTVEVESSQVENEFASNIAGLNRDFFMAGGDSGAGLNIYSKIDDNTNQFTVGFVKVGIPGYITGTTIDSTLNIMQTTAYNVELVIPLRMSVIVSYNIAYTGNDVYGEGEEGEDDTDFFKDIEGDLNEFAVKYDLTMEQLGLIIVFVGIIIIIVVRRRG